MVMLSPNKKNFEHQYLTAADATRVREALTQLIEELSTASICMSSPNAFRIETKDACVKLNLLSTTGCTRIAMSFKAVAQSLWQKLMQVLSRFIPLREAAPIKIKEDVVDVSVPEARAKSVAEIVREYIDNENGDALLNFTDKAIDQAMICPFRHTKKLTEVLHRLNIASHLMRAGVHRGKSLTDFFVKQVGLPMTFNLSDTQEQKYGKDYDAEHGGQIVRGRWHVTIGSGMNDAECMSVHFLFCNECQSLVITRCGAHGRTAL